MYGTEPVMNDEPVRETGSTIQVMTKAAKDGAADAKEAAVKLWSNTSLFFSRFVYTTSYTISYGVVFPTVLIARSIPKNNILVKGLIEGAEAASAKVDEIRAGSPSTATVPALA